MADNQSNDLPVVLRLKRTRPEIRELLGLESVTLVIKNGQIKALKIC